MKLGYNTNGLAHHDPLQAIELLASLNYKSIALTVDHGLLSPLQSGTRNQVREIGQCLRDHNMSCVIETGARFLLDSRTKHEPTLVTSDETSRLRRVDFYRYCLDMAKELSADCVSLWSGILHDAASTEAVLERLADGLQLVLHHAESVDLPIGFEPEPGMFIDRMSSFERLQQWVNHERLRLTLDIGHLYCQGEVPLADYIRRYGSQLVNVHLEDMRAGVHEHLMFGEGEIRFEPVLAALAETGYRGGVHVELSRHSHDAVNAARQAVEFLSKRWPSRSEDHG